MFIEIEDCILDTNGLVVIKWNECSLKVANMADDFIIEFESVEQRDKAYFNVKRQLDIPLYLNETSGKVSGCIPLVRSPIPESKL